MKEFKKEKANRDEKGGRGNFKRWEEWSWRQEPRIPTWRGVLGTGHMVVRQFAAVGEVACKKLGSLLWDKSQRQVVGMGRVGNLGLRSLPRRRKRKI